MFTRAPNQLFTVICLLTLSCIDSFAQKTSEPLPSLQQALDSREDLWGLAAMREPNGPNFDFFAKLLPPLRYVNADFRVYPIVLSAPNSPVKARFVANGSAINARAVLNTWTDVGVPFDFTVFDKTGWGVANYGEKPDNLTGPVYDDGWLPIVQSSYKHGDATYAQEAFAAVEPELASHGVVYVRFTSKPGKSAFVAAQIGNASVDFRDAKITDTNNNVLAWCSKNWKWDSMEHRLVASLDRPAFLAIATKPFTNSVEQTLTASTYERHRERCKETWETLIESGTDLDTPEPRVNNALRALLVQNYALVNGNEPRYSAQNAYDRLYEAECDDVMESLMLWGFANDTKRMLPIMLDYSRDKLDFHNAGFKLQALAHYYWLTRDKNFLEASRSKWSKEVDRIVNGREPQLGLAPRERYCGDIATLVYSLNASATGWRGLHDMAAILADAGHSDEAVRLSKIEKEFRQKILDAAEKSIYTNTKPPFIPIALFGEDKPHDPLTGSMLGSYWNLLAPYILGSQVFGHGSAHERNMLDYIHTKGGVFTGMIRFHQHSGLFANEDAVDDLYGLRYVTTLLRLDEVDRARVAFYGKLAQGMTRDTYIGAEGTGLRPSDKFGRPMYLPPNTSANAHWLYALRYMLVQDFDLNDDGKPETLRLLFATPKAWLADGKEIELENAPTAFGPVSVSVESHLKRGYVTAEVSAPKRNRPDKMLLRINLPDGWKVDSAKVHSKNFSVDDRGTIDLTGTTGKFTVSLQVQPR